MNIASTLRQAPRSAVLTALLALALGAAACNPIVVGGGGTGGGAQGGTGGSEHGGTGGSAHGGTGGSPNHPTPGAPDALGVPYLLIEGNQNTGTGASSSSGGGTTIDPSTLYVQVGNFGQSCPGTTMPTCTSTLTWQVSVGIPPALQVPGVIQLSDPALISTFSESGADPSTGDCFGGGGSAVQGTIEIVSIDASTIVVRLAGTGTLGNGVDADGEYTAPICPTGV